MRFEAVARTDRTMAPRGAAQDDVASLKGGGEFQPFYLLAIRPRSADCPCKRCRCLGKPPVHRASCNSQDRSLRRAFVLGRARTNHLRPLSATISTNLMSQLAMRLPTISKAAASHAVAAVVSSAVRPRWANDCSCLIEPFADFLALLLMSVSQNA